MFKKKKKKKKKRKNFRDIVRFFVPEYVMNQICCSEGPRVKYTCDLSLLAVFRNPRSRMVEPFVRRVFSLCCLSSFRLLDRINFSFVDHVWLISTFLRVK